MDNNHLEPDASKEVEEYKERERERERERDDMIYSSDSPSEPPPLAEPRGASSILSRDACTHDAPPTCRKKKNAAQNVHGQTH